MSTAPELTITVLDTATIFEGPDSIFRYDLPGSGVVEGWALAGVIDQASKVSGPSWPDLPVRVVADSTGTDVSAEAVVIIARHLRMAGVATVHTSGDEPFRAARPATSGTAPDTAAGTNDPGDNAPPTTEFPAVGVDRNDTASQSDESDARDPWGRPRKLRMEEAQSGSRLPRRGALIAGAAALVGVVVVGGGLAMSGRGAVGTAGTVAASTDVLTAAPESAVAADGGVTADGGDGGIGKQLMSAAPSERAPGPAAPPPERVIVDGMAVSLPPGFHWEVDEGLVTATGADPNLRVLLAADPLYAVPPEALWAEIAAEVERDPTLSDLQEVEGRRIYLETPGDGSTVAWTTWVDGDQQMSVGCHTRAEPTVIHKAACRMAVDSLTLAP